ncbi:hypothetical protein QUF74_18820 [Candidatus Halobeggiatoa sp. HSG11]|nr:hypothetical protein [Candidatus Halobeggiatoa sp. HSG11]
MDYYYNDTDSGGFILSMSNDETKFSFLFTGSFSEGSCRAGLGNNDVVDCTTKTSTNTHTIKFKVKDGVVKSYINSAFFQSYVLEQPNAIFTEMLISEIDTDVRIYSIKSDNLNGTNITPISNSGSSYDDGFNAGKQACISNPTSCDITIDGTSVSGDCTADYLNGQLHIPCVSVSDPFGGKTIYDIKMQQQTGGFTFDLDMGSVKPR